jgi:hypothetical protein
MAKQQEGGGNRFLGFEPVTMVPFESDLILADMMTSKQVSLLKNAHHHLYITHHLFLMCTFLFFFLAQSSQTKQSTGENCHFYLVIFCWVSHFVFPCLDEVAERLPPTGPAECRRRVATTTTTKPARENIRHFLQNKRMLALAPVQNSSATPLRYSPPASHSTRFFLRTISFLTK